MFFFWMEWMVGPIFYFEKKFIKFKILAFIPSATHPLCTEAKPIPQNKEKKKKIERGECAVKCDC